MGFSQARLGTASSWHWLLPPLLGRPLVWCRVRYFQHWLSNRLWVRVLLQPPHPTPAPSWGWHRPWVQASVALPSSHPHLAKSGGRQRGWGPPGQQQRLGSTKTPLLMGSDRAARCFQAPSHLPTLSSHQSLETLPRSKAEQNKASRTRQGKGLNSAPFTAKNPAPQHRDP